MRRWNADPRHTKKLKFYGVDMQFTPVAARNVIAALPAGNPARDALQPLLFRRHPRAHRASRRGAMPERGNSVS